MSTTARTLIDRTMNILNDATGGVAVRWTDAEMFEWITEGQREAVRINNNLYTKTVVRTLASGARQTLADLTDYMMLVDVPRNMASDGVTPARTINKVDPELLDGLDPSWQVGIAITPSYHYMFTPMQRTFYLVYPPAVGGSKLEIIYAAIPPAITAATDTIVVQDSVAAALVSYLCYRAISKESEFADAGTIALAHLKIFTDTVPTL